MHKLVVVTDPESAIGFRLAGAEAFEAPGGGDARQLIQSLVDRSDLGILAISEEILGSLDVKFRDRLEKMHKPIVISIPSISPGIDKKGYIERLLRRAIGYNIVMRR